jgi:hypothetical protein
LSESSNGVGIVPRREILYCVEVGNQSINQSKSRLIILLSSIKINNHDEEEEEEDDVLCCRVRNTTVT